LRENREKYQEDVLPEATDGDAEAYFTVPVDDDPDDDGSDGAISSRHPAR
jgi:hypothetical protein